MPELERVIARAQRRSKGAMAPGLVLAWLYRTEAGPWLEIGREEFALEKTQAYSRVAGAILLRAIAANWRVIPDARKRWEAAGMGDHLPPSHWGIVAAAKLPLGEAFDLLEAAAVQRVGVRGLAGMVKGSERERAAKVCPHCGWVLD